MSRRVPTNLNLKRRGAPGSGMTCLDVRPIPQRHDMTEAEIDKLFADSGDYMNVRIEEAKRVWSISDYDRFVLDQPSGTIRWSTAGQTRLIADFQFVGSFAESSRTWLWGWANSHMLPHLVQDIGLVRTFGEKHDIAALTVPRWEATLEDSWQMTAIAARLLEAQTVYRPPNKLVYVFLTIKNLRWA
jgi:hypothetical protein